MKDYKFYGLYLIALGIFYGILGITIMPIGLISFIPISIGTLIWGFIDIMKYIHYLEELNEED